MITQVISAPVPLIKNRAGAGYCMTYAIDNLRGCEGAMLKQQALVRPATSFAEAAALYDFHTEIILAGVNRWNSNAFLDSGILSDLRSYARETGGYIVAALHVEVRAHKHRNHFVMLIIGIDDFFIIDSLNDGNIYKVYYDIKTSLNEARNLLRFDVLHRVGLEVQDPNTHIFADVKSYKRPKGLLHLFS